jgi:alkylation response protein AidB-like acyl-CoA dehydrogenase
LSLFYTEEQTELITLVRQMAENEIKPRVQECDEKGECPRELFQHGFDMGLHMLEIPERFGGTGLSYETTAMIFEELAKADAGYAISFVTTFVALRSVILSGTEEQGQYFAGKIAPGRFASFALTEPDAGSDPAGMRGTAVLDGDEYVLNANKTFITNGGWADIYVGFFKTDPSAGSKGISAFMIDRSSPGITTGKHENKMGLRLSNTTDVIFEDVRVPRKNMLGQPGSGMKIALNTLNLSRAFVATMAVGIMQRALDESVKYAKERKQFGKPIIKFQMVQQLLADMAIKIEASRCLVNNTMRMMDHGNLVQKEGAITKTFVSDCAQEVTSNAVQIFGGYGYSKEYPVEKLMRDAKVFQIFEGANQVQRMTIARVLERECK